MINIQLVNYELDKAERIIIEHLMSNHQGQSSHWYAMKLGITTRTFYRLVKKHNIMRIQGLSLQRSIDLLHQHGFVIHKKHEQVLNTQEPTVDEKIKLSQFSVRNLQTSEVLHKTEADMNNMYQREDDSAVYEWMKTAKVGDQMTYFSERITKLS